MSRPQKDKLEYFPFDVDIFEDDKLFDVQNEYGPLGEIIYIRLLCLIYKNGYYYKFETLDKLASLLVRSIGSKWVRDKKTVVQVIPFLAKCNLFSSELMQENVLTSASIQKRYLKATERRQSLNNKPYWLLEEKDQHSRIAVRKNGVNVYNNSVNVDNNSVNVDNNATNKSKVNKSKVNNKCVLNDKYIGENQENTHTFKKPTLSEVKDYAQFIGCPVNIEKFYYFYESNDWTVNGEPIRNWEAQLNLWWHGDKEKKEKEQPKQDKFICRNYDNETLDGLFESEEEEI